MKLFICNGKRLAVHDVGPVLMELVAGAVPIKEHGTRLVPDETARRRLRALLDSKLYQRTI